MNKTILILGLFTLSFSYHAQNTEPCSQVKKQKEYLEAHPELKDQFLKNQEDLEKFTKQFIANSSRQSGSCQFVIPVVFHILHDNGPENISDQQVHDAIKLLNQNFNGLNPDTVSVVPEFKSIVGNAGIEFRLATLDPSGNPTTGITRDQFTSGTQPNIQGIQWPRHMYMNVYTADNLGQGVGGFTYLPGTVGPMDDAIFVLYNTLQGTTLTHEVGHWLNLMHNWGWSNDPGQASNCNMDDQVQDTPETIGWTTCNLSGTSCGSLDNVQNYMEYSFCTNMFTQGQADRMIAALNSTIADRNNLWAPSNLSATGVDQLTAVDFSSNFTVICRNNYVQYYDESTFGQCNWDWSFPGGNPSTSSDKYPNSYYDSPGTYDVSLTVSDGFTAFTNNKVGHVFVADPVSNYLPIQEGFETMIALSDDWGIINPDQDNISWKLGSVGATGSVSAMLENVNNTNPNIIDELVSPGVDLSPFNSAAIEFKYAYARKTASDNDKLIFRVSTDCGYSWDLLWVGTGNTLATAVDQTQPFVPSTDDWQTQTINVPTPFLEEGFIYKFQFISGGGNNIYLDDINISGTYKDTPILYQPADGAKVYSTDVKIDWKALGGLITYEYQVALDPNFNSLVSSGIKAYISANPLNSDTEELLSGLTIGQKYYWRVRGGSNNGLTNWSQTWEFEPAAIPLDITEQQFTEDINLYPNPANAMVNISGKTLTNYSSLVLRNGLGQTIKMIPINQNELITVPLENLVSGLYFFEFVAEHQTSKVLKFIKE